MVTAEALENDSKKWYLVWYYLVDGNKLLKLSWAFMI